MFTLRVARPTDNLPEVLKFYRDGLGLDVLTSFNHLGYEGEILGRKGLPYHLEFTHQAGHKVGKAPTQDHLLVFYIPDEADWKRAVERMQQHGYKPVISYNPYWDNGGKTFEDVDGYRVVLHNRKWGL
jgi:catechol 2,3-dioxygenase-like lactoylglutathione lyase family enzyme